MTTKISWEELIADTDDDNLVAADGTSTSSITMTVVDTGAFDCGVCYLPLRPPIFQCIEGHAVCSTCREKLMATGNARCHVCRVDIAGHGGYTRSHSLERMVESVHVACRHAGDGCAAMPVYYDRSRHRRRCPYAPRRCPLTGCGFVGPAGPLLRHVFGGPHFDVDEADGGNGGGPAAAAASASAAHGRCFDLKRLACLGIWAEEFAKAREEDQQTRAQLLLPRDDVELVMAQAGDMAIRALRESDGDVIGAIAEVIKSILLRKNNKKES